MPPLIIAVVATFAITTAADAQTASAPPVHTQTDPAVVAYTALANEVEPDVPIDQAKATALFDLLLGTLEGFALGCGVSDQALYSRIHDERQELRQFAGRPSETPDQKRHGHQFFSALVQLVKDIDQTLGPHPHARPAIEAFERSAQSLEFSTPLRLQSHNIHQFLKLGGEVLTRMSERPVSCRR